MKAQDETGSTYGHLTVIRHAPVSTRAIWQCRCKCGGLVNYRGADLRSGQYTSCGCKMSQRTHGLTRTPEWMAWQCMRKRCNNRTSMSSRNYAGRDISVCERWGEFENFLADMGPKPGPEYSLDRIDNDGNYEPGNCRWATAQQQANNRRTKRLFVLRGTPRTVAELSAIAGVPALRIRNRILKSGWSVERATMTPLHAQPSELRRS